MHFRVHCYRTPTAEPATDRPSVSAVSAGWPSRSTTTAAHKVRTGALLTITGITVAKRLNPGQQVGVPMLSGSITLTNVAAAAPPPGDD